MQHTTKYKFNLIETSDTFSPEALNKNTEAVETQLAALAAADAANKSALEAADAAIRADLGSVGKTARIATGSYVGKGYSGSSYPCAITVDFKPMLVFVGPSDRDSGGVEWHVMFRPANFTATSGVSMQVIWADRKVTWYSISYSNQATEQLNKSGVTYRYVVIGIEE